MLKYAALLTYLHAYASVAEAKAGIGAWLRFYNEETAAGTTANKGFDVDEVKSRLVEPTITPTAVGADIETSRATP